MVAFRNFVVNVSQLLNQLAQVSASAIWKQPFLHGTTIGEKPNAVTCSQSNFRQTQCGIYRKIKFRQAGNSRAHKAPGINHQPDSLTSLYLIDTRDQFSATRSRSPADVTNF